MNTTEKAEPKAKDERSKILIGAMIMEQMSEDAETKATVLRALDRCLTLASDRALFAFAQQSEPGMVTFMREQAERARRK